MDQQLVEQFSSVTGSSPALAQQYLQLCDNSLEQAVGLFYANEGAELEPAAPSGQAPPIPHPSARPPPQQTSHTDGRGAIYISDDEVETDPQHVTTNKPTLRSREQAASRPTRQDHASSMEDDEAMARRLQEEFYGGAEANSGPLVDSDGYRAPIARTTQTLIGPGSFDPSSPEDMRAAVMEQMMARRQPRHRGGSTKPLISEQSLTEPERPGIFNQDPHAHMWNRSGPGPTDQREMLSRATGGASESSSKASSLAEMYRPPFELISRLSWDEAREEGKADEKWILVNIQDPSIFDCQILNRDLWKHPGIVETIRENFLFMQYSKDNPRGNQYIQYYFQNKDNDSAYPHIAIVDPRTGEQVKVWSGPPAPKAMDFLIQLHEFLDRYSLKASAKNPVAKRKAQPKQETQVDRMTEEQQMEMALQASLAGSGSEVRESDPDDLTRSIGNLDQASSGNPIDAQESSINGAATLSSAFSSISSSHPHTEPGPDPSTTRIQFRHPTGRVVRRFALSDPVRRIFEWLKADPIDGKVGIEFELIFMQKNLLTALDHSIEEAGLRNGTVMVEFNETN